MARIETGKGDAERAVAEFARGLLRYVEDGNVVELREVGFVRELLKAVEDGGLSADDGAEDEVYYAVVRWTAGDVLGRKPGWSEDRADDWFAANAKYVEDAMVERGWEVIEQLLGEEEDGDEEEEEGEGENGKTQV
jgi:hypothetical protein